MSEINKRIYKIIRSDKKLTQSGLASHLGKSSSTLSQWFSEDRPIPADCIIPICEYLNVSIMWLLTGSDYNSNLLNMKNYNEEQILLQNFSALPKNVKERVLGYIEGHLDALKNPPN
ncbi:MAG: helix-turn-helix domain-containing protein [Lachnospiraceae bacterium]|nr:helix-turn-helix domain-containing protein [Lachnospiraceae bacterium]